MDKDDLGALGATKPWYLSKGVIGSLIAATAIIAGFFGLKVDATTQQVVTDQATALVTAVFALGGTLLGLYGRLTATKLITGR